MNFKIKNYLPIIILVILAFSSQAFAQDKTNSDTTKSKMKKMGCRKNMDHSKHEMKDEEKIDIEKIDLNKDGKVFIDGMYKDVVKDEPGNCPKCGMKLKEVTLEEAKKFIEKNDTNTQTQMKKMDCSKKMEHADHEMKSEKTEMDEQDKIDLEKIDKNKDCKVYQCPMCADQIADEPGKCSKCEMNFKEVSLEDAQKAMNKKSHGMMDHSKMDGHKMDHSKMMNHDMKPADHNKIDMKKDNLAREGKIDLTAIDKNGDQKVFQDPMDWNVISDEAGECPLCGMKLKEVTLEKAKENLNRHGFKIK